VLRRLIDRDDENELIWKKVKGEFIASMRKSSSGMKVSSE